MMEPDILVLCIMGHRAEEPAQFEPTDLTRHQLQARNERAMDRIGSMFYQDLGGES